MRRTMDFMVLLTVGVMVCVVLFGGAASLSHALGPNAPVIGGNKLWLMTGLGGFALGLSWRFLFWDMPGIAWRWLTSNRRNLQYACVLLAGVVVLVFI